MFNGTTKAFMRFLLFCCFLVPGLLAGGEADPCLKLAFSPSLGVDPTAEIHLIPSGSLKGLWLRLGAETRDLAPDPSSTPTTPARRHRMAQATVEVWDFALPEEPPRQQTFRLFREVLLLSIKDNWRFAPPSHGHIDAAIRGGGNGAGADMAMVKSLQQRFNSLPPNGSPVR